MPSYTLLDRYVWELTQEEYDFVQRLSVTPEQVEDIKKIPQRTPSWRNWRRYRLTASNFGSAANHNPYKQPEGLVGDMLWSTFKGNAATQYGSDREQVACDIYELHMKLTEDKTVWVQHQGLWIVQQMPMFGLSVDGLVHIDDKVQLLEIKCPYRKRFYPGIPHYYADQIQGIMGFLDIMGSGVDWADFVVYTPAATRVERYAFQKEYFYEELLPAMLDWYRNVFLPVALMYERGELKTGFIEPSVAFRMGTDGLEEDILPGDPPRPLEDSNPEMDREVAATLDREEASVTERLHQDNLNTFSMEARLGKMFIM